MRKSRPKIKIDLEELKDLYNAGNSVHTIGKLLGINYQTIHNRMKEFNIPRRKLGEFQKGKPHTIEHSAKIAQALKGRSHTSERKANISRAKIGKPSWLKGLKKATSQKLANFGSVGETHWNWQGGISAKRNRFRQSSEYKAWRLAVFTRDNFTCVKCGHKSKGDIEADHIKSQSLFPELVLDVNNGQTLCKPCHKDKTKEDYKQWLDNRKK